MYNPLQGIAQHNARESAVASAFYNAFSTCGESGTPLERLNMRLGNAKFKLQVAQQEIEEIESAIKTLEDSPIVTKVLDCLTKLGVLR